jgi:bacteriorhodopsin
MKNLSTNDYVGISFWVISIALAASTVFLLVERESMKPKWKLPVSVSGMVTGIAASHYYYMREIWVVSKKNPIIYRYIDWILTVPLQIIEFYLILSVAKKIPIELFYKLLLASVIMIVAGFLGESKVIDRNLGFIIGTIAWLYILYEIFYGEAAKFKEETEDESVKFAFDALKWIVTVGWAIYPIGYLLEINKMNLLYNLGDLVNKILFTLIIWYAGKQNGFIIPNIS